MKILVRAKPNSKVEGVEKIGENEFEVRVKEPPVKGRANAAIIESLAEYFNVSLSLVRMISGRASRIKTFEINS